MRTKNIAMILTLALTAGLCQTAAPSQAATPKLSAKKLTMKVGKTAALKVKKTSKKAKWSIVSGKKNIRLTAKKKTSVKVKAVKAGKAKISCKQGNSVWPDTTMCSTDTKSNCDSKCCTDTKPDRDSKCYTDTTADTKSDSSANQHPNADAGSYKSAGAYS